MGLSQCRLPKSYDCTAAETDKQTTPTSTSSTWPSSQPVVTPSQPASGAMCNVGSYVPCCIGEDCGSMHCQGDQCCLGADGQHTTCPSASVAHLSQCRLPKSYDCTSSAGDTVEAL